MTLRSRLGAMPRIAYLVAVAAVFFASACSERQQIPEAFVGTWRSDEALTLASLDDSKGVTSADIRMFSDEFFGNRVIVYKAREFRAYWVGGEWSGVEQEVRWIPYDIVASGPDFMTLQYPATDYTEAEQKTWRIDGALIYVEEPKWDFKEYYRRID